MHSRADHLDAEILFPEGAMGLHLSGMARRSVRGVRTKVEFRRRSCLRRAASVFPACGLKKGGVPFFCGMAPVFQVSAPFLSGGSPFFGGMAPFSFFSAPFFRGGAPVGFFTAPFLSGGHPAAFFSAPFFQETAPFSWFRRFLAQRRGFSGFFSLEPRRRAPSEPRARGLARQNLRPRQLMYGSLGFPRHYAPCTPLSAGTQRPYATASLRCHQPAHRPRLYLRRPEPLLRPRWPRLCP